MRFTELELKVLKMGIAICVDNCGEFTDSDAAGAFGLKDVMQAIDGTAEQAKGVIGSLIKKGVADFDPYNSKEGCYVLYPDDLEEFWIYP